jgi:probable phosphoglycerate mutase
MLLFYIRHGDPIYSPDSLTPLGQEQAKALAKRLLLCDIRRVYSSPSTRARMTAQPFCDLTRMDMTICDWADEGLAGRDFFLHTDEGHGWCFQIPAMVQRFNTPAVRNLGARWYEHPDLAGYTFERGVKRVDEAVDGFLLSLGLRHDRENARFEVVGESPERVALFAHQGFGMLFFSSLLDIPYPFFCTHFDFGHSSMTVVNFERQGDYVYPKVLQLANDSHLYREGLLTGYHNIIRF